MADENVSMTELEIRLRWPLENDLPVIYANHAALVFSKNEVALVFGTFVPTGMHHRSEEEVREFLDQATVQPVAKIVMTKEGYKSVYNMLEKNAKELE